MQRGSATTRGCVTVLSHIVLVCLKLHLENVINTGLEVTIKFSF